MPFLVSYKAFYIHPTESYAIIGSSLTGTKRIYFSIPPYSRWYDVTDNYPNAASSNGGAITGIAVI